jgi:hypothetical protein
LSALPFSVFEFSNVDGTPRFQVIACSEIAGRHRMAAAEQLSF